MIISLDPPVTDLTVILRFQDHPDDKVQEITQEVSEEPNMIRVHYENYKSRVYNMTRGRPSRIQCGIPFM